MASKQLTREKRGRPSHREDLRQELLDAAKAFIVREGYESVSMRRLSDEIGVSSAAPYHHFPDRRALLLAIALDGYRTMFESSLIGVDSTEPREILRGLLLNFLRFAAHNRRLFALMYESELVREGPAPEILEAQDQGFRSLHEIMLTVAPELPDRERAIRTATLWCAVYGFALQTNHAMIRTPQPEPERDELAEALVAQALRLFDA
ncbi:MAG: TetR family transcriptional regulator [Novosphingobium sp. 17-62-19]|uniref:TetR/AcrR family transcriptional regulator n=1 Tax=Novosphingobium sp. 17-62-19 TaxID=1970406 RepID=UPI000BC7C766|nr:TetR/AcrR family transcriptional regulator [Novosphingobium sp. 17-62-19]OZA17044.1 MAG: TetR family transcriptional regulator [Novosphingobium sp. 17-62-19]OZA72403.1 MAG: TetR family transcriptional regulator [Sphingomonadales bacterium 39-62-4]HQS97561.1 TetR/AcrR family transcriptional regulator [Novosphingobium sp.]